MHVKYLKKVNLNYNMTNVELEDIKKVKECFRGNKVLEEVRMRSCGYNEKMLVEIV